MGSVSRLPTRAGFPDSARVVLRGGFPRLHRGTEHRGGAPPAMPKAPRAGDAPRFGTTGDEALSFGWRWRPPFPFFIGFYAVWGSAPNWMGGIRWWGSVPGGGFGHGEVGVSLTPAQVPLWLEHPGVGTPRFGAAPVCGACVPNLQLTLMAVGVKYGPGGAHAVSFGAPNL